MCRFALTVLLMINLLICPFVCMSEVAGTVEAGEPVQLCACCISNRPYVLGESATSGGDSDSGNPLGDVPADDCFCPNCICDGAIAVVDGITIPELAEQPFLIDWQIQPASNGQPTFAHRRHSHPPNLCKCGRAALITYQVWLI